MRRQTNENDWPYSSEPPRFDFPDTFDAWVAASDSRGPSAFAWQISLSGRTGIKEEDSRPSDGDDSDESRAYVAGVYRVIEALPANSVVTIHCRNEYVVKAFSCGWLKQWSLNKWKSKSGRPIHHQEIWKRVLLAREGDEQNPRNISVYAVHIGSNDLRFQEIFERLMKHARETAKQRSNEFDNAPGGFGAVALEDGCE